tara:strand:- start:561 stop:935 length:375 start_codon:yes stop_codon:yes gene_type:complete
MKQSHTNGPWAFNPSIDNTESYHGYHIGPLCQKGLAMDNLVKSIAFTSNSNFSVSSEECLANAKLIAAAPEMLAALKGAQSALRKALPLIECPDDLTHNGTQTYCGEWLVEITEVISKATEASE